MGRIALGLCVTSLLSLGCVERRQNEASDLGVRRAEYAILAANLAPPLREAGGKAPNGVDPAVLRARETWRVVNLAEISTRDARIKAIAKVGAEAHAKVLEIAEQSIDVDVIFAVAAALAGAPIVPAVIRTATTAQHYDQQLRDAVLHRRSATLLLSDLAKELAGPTSSTSPLMIDFDENWYARAVPDRIRLKNVTSWDLTNCTVQVDVRGKSGVWVRNVHYVASWPTGGELSADYASVEPTDIAAISGISAVEVQALVVSLWSDQLRLEGQELRYAGKARDEDLMRQLDELMSVSLDYVENPLFESGPCIGVTLQGVASLPRCTIELNCHGLNNVDRKLEATVDGWREGGRQSLQSRGALQGRPNEVSVVVRLEGVDGAWKRTVLMGRPSGGAKR